MENQDIAKEDTETDKSRGEAMENEFLSKLMSEIPGTQSPAQPEAPQQ